MFTDQLAALSRDDGHIRSRIFHRDDRFWLREDKHAHIDTKIDKKFLKRNQETNITSQRLEMLMMRGFTCLVKTILPSRKGGTRL